MRVPHLNRLHQSYQDEGLAVVGVANEDPRRLKDFIAERAVAFPVVLDAKAFRDYGVRSVPDAVLVGPDGTVRFHGHPDQLTEGVIRKWLPRDATGSSGERE